MKADMRTYFLACDIVLELTIRDKLGSDFVNDAKLEERYRKINKQEIDNVIDRMIAGRPVECET
jgi:hypothetical protein